MCPLSITHGQALIFAYAINIYWEFVYMSYKKDPNMKKNMSFAFHEQIGQFIKNIHVHTHTYICTHINLYVYVHAFK